MITSFIPF
jgi:hypothetical protein